MSTLSLCCCFPKAETAVRTLAACNLIFCCVCIGYAFGFRPMEYALVFIACLQIFGTIVLWYFSVEKQQKVKWCS